MPKKQVEAVSLYVAEWLRLAFAQFLSSESRSLMGIGDLEEFKLYAIDRFPGILYAAVKTSRKTNSPIPARAEAKVIEAWKVPTFENWMAKPIAGGTLMNASGRPAAPHDIPFRNRLRLRKSLARRLRGLLDAAFRKSH